MPCFKGLAVSIHTPDGALCEYSVQKSNRVSRISTFIPVPPPRIPVDSTSTKPEPSSFAISITLLTPGQEIPYSGKTSPDQPHAKPKFVGSLPGHGNDQGKPNGGTQPYIPLTTSPNETIAAYIYFDGRAKEEVATLLRKGEETWVNSRWVSVPESEGGGLAEREFLFREVGLERWLNGLDLEGKDAAATIEKRRQKLEKRRGKRKERTTGSDDETNGRSREPRRTSTLRYGPDGQLQHLSDDDDDSISGSSDSDDDDDDPIPEAAGQIKVALFRVLASGEIKRGEYSPQFDAHDDDEDSDGRNGHSGSGETKDVDHTTSFAKPKSLDPKTISTQTVTGIDPTDKPYAVFTFLYRGQRQLQKMGILPTPESTKTPAAVKRRSLAADIPSLGPLKKEGTVGFSTFRDIDSTNIRRKGKKKDVDAMDSDSDADDEIVGKMEDIDESDVKRETGLLSPEDAERTGQVAEGIRKMRLKRQHSAEPLNSNGNVEARKSSKSGSPSGASTPHPNHELNISTSVETSEPVSSSFKKEDDFMVGSPLKKQRASMAGFDESIKSRLASANMSTSGTIGEILGSGTISAGPESTSASKGGLQFGGALLKQTDNDEDGEL